MAGSVGCVTVGSEEHPGQDPILNAVRNKVMQKENIPIPAGHPPFMVLLLV